MVEIGAGGGTGQRERQGREHDLLTVETLRHPVDGALGIATGDQEDGDKAQRERRQRSLPFLGKRLISATSVVNTGGIIPLVMLELAQAAAGMSLLAEVFPVQEAKRERRIGNQAERLAVEYLGE